MSEEKSASWWGSFDQMLSGAPGVRRFQAGRDAKYKNPFGPRRPKKQQLWSAEDGEQGSGDKTREKALVRMDPAKQQDEPHQEHQDNFNQLRQDVAQELEEQQQQQHGSSSGSRSRSQFFNHYQY